MHDINHTHSVVDGRSDDQIESVTPTCKRKQLLGLALFSLPQILLLWMFAPYTFSISSTTHLPPEVKGISGPALMAVWGITGGSFWLLVLVAFAFLFKRSSTIESLANWATVLMILSIFFCLGFFYIAIHGEFLALILAIVMLVSVIYHRIVVLLLSDSCMKKKSKDGKK